MAEEQKKSNVQNSTEAAERHASNAANALDAKLSGPLAPLERGLDEMFGEKASYQLPSDIKDTLVKIAPWLSLLAGVFGLFSAFSLWQAAHRVNRVLDSFNQLSTSLGIDQVSAQLGLTFWISLGMTLVFAVLALLAFPGLKAKKKVGWNLMFYSLIANVGYGVASLFYYRMDIGSLLGAVIMSAIGAYILFQVRSRYEV